METVVRENPQPPSHSTARRAAAWGVHLFTATGALWGLLATVALLHQEYLAMFWWLVAAVLVDSVDGALARWVRVKEVLPRFDGALLDNIVDYLTYAFVPALYFYDSGLLPEGAGLAAAGLVALASAYQFAQTDAKTADHFFLGFPSYWSIVALYLLFLDLPAWTAFGVVLTCVVLVFVPFKYAYPSQMTRFRALTIVLTLVWGVSILAMLAAYPSLPTWAPWASLLYVAYYMAVSYVSARLARVSDAEPRPT